MDDKLLIELELDLSAAAFSKLQTRESDQTTSNNQQQCKLRSELHFVAKMH